MIRNRVANFCELGPPLQGGITVDKSYFYGKRIKAKRVRADFHKTPVFGMLQRNGKVSAEIVPDCAKATLQAVIRGKIDLMNVVHSDCWSDYNRLIDLGYKKYFRVHHRIDYFSSEESSSMASNPAVHS